MLDAVKDIGLVRLGFMGNASQKQIMNLAMDRGWGKLLALVAWGLIHDGPNWEEIQMLEKAARNNAGTVKITTPT